MLIILFYIDANECRQQYTIQKYKKAVDIILIHKHRSDFDIHCLPTDRMATKNKNKKFPKLAFDMK